MISSVSGESTQDSRDLPRSSPREPLQSSSNFDHFISPFYSHLSSLALKDAVQVQHQRSTLIGQILTIAGKSIEIKGLLGIGSYGVVLHGLHNKQKVAIKFFKAYDTQSDFLEAYENELYALKKMNRYISDDIVNRVIIETYIHGVTLESLLEQSVRRRDESRIRILKQKYDLLAAEFFENYYLLHGDIAPRNVLVNDEGKMQLIDFGTTTLWNPKKSNQQDALTHEQTIANVEWELSLLHANIEHNGELNPSFFKQYDRLQEFLQFLNRQNK
jgi:hypothetical protein